jgi:CDP-diacylglycerol--glycerol-3-phosphate 3-phosphatidyltransferase
MANVITATRIVLSALLLSCPALSPAFLALYLAAGATDAIDGAVARRTGTVSEFGSRLDTVADIAFVLACLAKLLPVVDLPPWLCMWIGLIASIKLANIALGYMRRGEFVAVHSTMNKVTGALLFAFPLTLTFLDLSYGAAVVCTVATAAAIHEGYTVWVGSR